MAHDQWCEAHLVPTAWNAAGFCNCRRRELSAEVAALRQERDEARADVVAAAGALMIDIPEPGTDMAKVMLANAAMRRERDEARADAARYRWLRDGERTLREWDSIRDLWESTLDAAIDAALKEEK